MGGSGMRIVFKGVIEKRQKGCPVCGRRDSKTHFVSIKSYILPSGRTVTFRAGRAEEVSPLDGAFLLEYKTQEADGTVRNVFEEVE